MYVYPLRAEKTGLHPNLTCVHGGRGSETQSAGMLRKPGDLSSVCARPKSLKGLPRATHCTYRAQTSGIVTSTVELCPPHPTFRKKVRTRRDMPEEEIKMTIVRILIGNKVTLGRSSTCANRLRQHYGEQWRYSIGSIESPPLVCRSDVFSRLAGALMA